MQSLNQGLLIWSIKEPAAALQACWDCRNMDMGAFLHSPLMAELEALEKLRRPSVVSAVGSLAASGTDEAREAAADGSCSWRGCGSEGGAARPLSSAGDTSVTAGSSAGRHAGDDPVPSADIGDDVGDSIEGCGGADAAEQALHCPICLVRPRSGTPAWRPVTGRASHGLLRLAFPTGRVNMHAILAGCARHLGQRVWCWYQFAVPVVGWHAQCD